MLQTAETRWGAAAAQTFRHGEPPPVALWVARLFPGGAVQYTEPQGAAKKPAVLVRVNGGVWQAQCPWCLSAQHASETDHRFYCADCCNVANGHKYLPVVWPENHAEIAAQLEKRPLPRWRNWEPGETVEDLQRQDDQAIAAGILTGETSG